MVETLEIFGFWELDAREVFPLSTNEGLQKTRSDQLREQ
jgi:hypothetical protein